MLNLSAPLSLVTVFGLVLITSCELRHTMAASCGETRPDFHECSLLSPSVALRWRDDGDAISIAMEVDGTWDWLGFGLSEAGGMEGADIAVIRRNLTDGTSWWIGDYWSNAFRMPALDTGNQDVYLLSAGWTNGSTTGVFKRPLDTCDEKEDMRILRGTTQYFIFAYGKGWGYHGDEQRGNAQLTLLPLRPSPPSLTASTPVNNSQTVPAIAIAPQPFGAGADSHVWEVRMSNLSIPAQDTAYLCRDFEVPNSKTKVHITNWQVAIDNPRQVHHMIIYACMARPVNPRSMYSCMAMDPSCLIFYAAWAPGADYFETPSEAGIALGGDSGVNWLILQVHYNNPALTTGLVDSSGFQLNVSTTLRQYDIGFLTLGTLDIAIPPGVANFSSTPNLCPSSCTKQMSRPVTMLMLGFHMHTLGRSIRTQWFRNGQELQVLGERRAFSFNYQGPVYVDVSRNLLMPGDELITTCTWDSRSRTNITRFGESTFNEMCFNMVMYYPRMPTLDICTSAPSALVGPSRQVAFCTTISRVAMLNAAVRSQNISTILGAYASMTKLGELVEASPRTYTSIAPVCSPYNFTNSRSGGGVNGSSDDGVSDNGPFAPVPPPPDTSVELTLPTAYISKPPPKVQPPSSSVAANPLPTVPNIPLMQVQPPVAQPLSPTSVAKPPPTASAKPPVQVQPPTPSTTDYTKTPPSTTDYTRTPPVAQPRSPTSVAKPPPTASAKPPVQVQLPTPSTTDYTKTPPVAQPLAPPSVAKPPPTASAKPPVQVQPPTPSTTDYTKTPPVAQPLSPTSIAKPPMQVQPPTPLTVSPNPLLPPTAAAKPAPQQTAAKPPLAPTAAAKPPSPPTAAAKSPPAKPSPRPPGPMDAASPPTPKPS
ncbi:hypothetical protein VaNZ11_007891 [Volvox africanus]|uniref:DOMON domain-containing protein n=1 Tax=Volvox africanus TaxID=51714 RepID=A0ABQ5S3W1_9CHLO|nr:hypothetical protein VaNZ11_007891 [Volvox africanus]